MSTTTWTTVGSPVGELRLATDGAALTRLEFLGALPDQRTARSSEALLAVRAATEPEGTRDDDHPLLAEARAQLAAYFARELKEFDLPVAPAGTPFQQRVWAALREIPYGTTTSYGVLAAGLGMTGHGARAVGLANGRNPVALVVPCHRVVGAGGSLVGYAGGIERKQWLLSLEQEGLF